MVKKVSKFSQQILRWLRKKENLLLTVFFLLLFVILFINAFHEDYPDEFDNILGGWYLIHGIPIYSGFFTHHGPVAYFLAGAITLISGNSFVLFRVIYAVLLFLFSLGSYLYLRQAFGSSKTYFYLAFLFILTLAGNYYWFHMLLADSLSAYLLAPVVTFLLLATLYKRKMRVWDITLISLLVAMSVLSSLTYVYVAMLIYLYSFYLYVRLNKLRLLSQQVVKAVVIFAAPYLLFLVYLLLSGGLMAYYRQAIEFNQKYYIYNYPRAEGVTSINPIRFAVVIANNFYNNYFTLLQQVKDFNVGFPVNITLAVGSLALGVYLLMKKQYLFTLLYFALLIFSNARSNPLTSAERDYQSAVYIVIAMMATTFVLSRVYKELEEGLTSGKKVIYTVLLFVVGLYAIFSTLFLFQKFFNRTYDKYMGNAPLIYDRPEVAPIINKLIEPNDPVWIGPFEFKELFYTEGRPASKYHILLPGMGQSPEIQQEMVADLEETKPVVIWFQSNFYILGRSPDMYGQFFKDYLKEHYVTLMQLREEGEYYKSQVAISEKVDIEGRLYIRKDKKEEVLNRLQKQDLIREVSEEDL